MRARESLGSYDEIVAAAVRTTGLDDFGGDEHEEGLQVLVESWQREAGLTPEGNHRMRASLKGLLVARLFAEHGFATRPDHASVEVTRPIVVTGLPRSGTTLLQRLLTAVPGHQGLEQWLADLPQPRPPRDTWADNPVFTGMQAAYAAFHQENPELAGVHYSDAATHEECWRLLQQAGRSVAFETQAHVPSYAEWLGSADWLPAYRRHRRLLQLIGVEDRDRRWVLKNPSHLMALDALLEVYPDAIVLVTHRDPATCVASMCSLAEVSTRGLSTVFTGARIGATQLDLLRREVSAAEAARSSLPAEQFLDIEYADLVGDPVGTVEAIHQRFGLGWDAGVAAAVRAALEHSRSGPRRPRHSYRLGDFGLSAADVRAVL